MIKLFNSIKIYIPIRKLHNTQYACNMFKKIDRSYALTQLTEAHRH